MDNKKSFSFLQVPSVELWFDIAEALYKYFMSEPTGDEKDDSVLQSSMMSAIYTDIKFSEQRCQKVLPLALARYQENLPSHYTRTHHETKVYCLVSSGIICYLIVLFL